MKANPLFIVALSTLIIVGAIGLWLIANDDLSDFEVSTIETQEQVSASSNLATNTETADARINNFSNRQNAEDLGTQSGQNKQVFEEFDELLRLKKFKTAMQLVSDNYSALSKVELDGFKSLFINATDKLSENQNKLALSALTAASDIFSDADVWLRIANTATKLENWDAALQAQINLFQLQSDPQEIAQSLRAMLLSSNELRAKFEGRNDELSIKNMYERILRVASNAPRFQLELAYSHLRLREEYKAKILLEQIIYDPELGNIAQETLDRLNESTAVVQTKPVTPKRVSTKGIVVPLEAFGTSFIVNTRIERQNTRLLLDTGASITALSRPLIDRLNLQPLNRQIRLNTANGTTLADLYKVDRLQLGRLVLKDIVVADIDMGNSSNFQGLLGTDTLNKLRADYDYVIDNGKKALIFRRK